jgi:hypothetical protein
MSQYTPRALFQSPPYDPASPKFDSTSTANLSHSATRFSTLPSSLEMAASTSSANQEQASPHHYKSTTTVVYKPPKGTTHLVGLKMIREKDPCSYFHYVLRREKYFLEQRSLQDYMNETYGFLSKNRPITYEATRIHWKPEEKKYYKKAFKQMKKDIEKHPKRPLLPETRQLIFKETEFYP